MNMQQVITIKQAKEITKGRTPLVPVEYEAAIKALAACLSLDDAKYWDNKADALAAWAKIYRDDKVGRQARSLKLFAYRRMGILAGELRPGGRQPGVRGAAPGPVTVLMESGLKKGEAVAARQLAKLPQREFNSLANALRPRSPLTEAKVLQMGTCMSKAWIALTQNAAGFPHFRAFCRRNEASEMARSLRADEAIKASEMLIEINEWLDKFEQYLPKQKRTQ